MLIVGGGKKALSSVGAACTVRPNIPLLTKLSLVFDPLAINLPLLRSSVHPEVELQIT